MRFAGRGFPVGEAAKGTANAELSTAHHRLSVVRWSLMRSIPFPAVIVPRRAWTNTARLESRFVERTEQ